MANGERRTAIGFCHENLTKTLIINRLIALTFFLPRSSLARRLLVENLLADRHLVYVHLANRHLVFGIEAFGLQIFGQVKALAKSPR